MHIVVGEHFSKKIFVLSWGQFHKAAKHKILLSIKSLAKQKWVTNQNIMQFILVLTGAQRNLA